MKTIFVTLAIFCCLTSSVTAKLDLKHEDLFVTWKMRFNKNYGNNLEEAVKYENFFNNYEFILDFNKENNGVQLALNQFADMTADEFGAMFLGVHADNSTAFDGTIYDENGVKIDVKGNVDVKINVNGNFLPNEDNDEEEDSDEPLDPEINLGQTATSINWVTKGAVTSVKNQPCGNCWSYSAAGAMEGYYYRKKGRLLGLSNQQLSDCVRTCSGCNGCGGLYQAIAYTSKSGIESQTDYPSTRTGSGSCKYSSAKVAIKNTGYKNVQARSASALKTALNIQPVQVAVQADQRVFQFYSSGVIQSGCGSSVNHAILAVGYTKVNGVDAFYVKNSWGTGWGINGYGYISSASANGGNGVCGILLMPNYPV